MTKEEKYMKAAIRQARKARQAGEVPIGCVIVWNDKIIARGYNKRMKSKSVLGHAELEAIKKANKIAGDWRLDECEMYVTLEPCPMCAGAVVQSRIKNVYIGAMNPKAGCAGSILNILSEPRFNHQCTVETGVLAQECSRLLREFFSELRNSHKMT